MLQYTDKAIAYLASSITAGATSVALQTGGGAKFPSALGSGRIAILKIEKPSTGDYELVRATALSGDTLTVVRGVGGTNQAFDVDAIVSLVASSHVFESLRQPNRFINGCLRLWDFGTSFSTPATGTMVANNWKITTAGAVGTFTISRQTTPVGSWEYDHPPKFALRWDQTVAGTGATLELEQRVEDVRQLANGKATVSFVASATGSPTLQVYLEQVFGTGGAPSSTVTLASQNVALTSSRVRYSVTFDLASISGKTLGSNGNDYVRAVIKFPGSATFLVDLENLQINKGPLAADFEVRPLALERQLAARYYWKTFNDDTAPAQNAGTDGALSYVVAVAGATQAGLMVRYPVPMRASPTLTFYNPSAANALWRNTTDAADSGAVATSFASNRGVLLRNPQVAGDGAGEVIAVHMQADANL